MNLDDLRSNGVSHPGYPVVASLTVMLLSGASSFWMLPQNTGETGTAQRRGPILQQRTVEDLPAPIALFDTVFWEPRDTDNLRRRIRETDQMRGNSVLEIGTGTGLLALCCLQAGAEQVVATDVNPAAVANARYNAERFGFTDERLEVRLVSLKDSGAFSVIGSDEQFDLIISNPPWENGVPKTISEHALYDPGFQLLNSLLASARRHLRPGGRIWLAYGCVEAIQKVQQLAERYRWDVRWLDDRTLAELSPVFLPGLLLELVPIEE